MAVAAPLSSALPSLSLTRHHPLTCVLQARLDQVEGQREEGRTETCTAHTVHSAAQPLHTAAHGGLCEELSGWLHRLLAILIRVRCLF